VSTPTEQDMFASNETDVEKIMSCYIIVQEHRWEVSDTSWGCIEGWLDSLHWEQFNDFILVHRLDGCEKKDVTVDDMGNIMCPKGVVMTDRRIDGSHYKELLKKVERMSDSLDELKGDLVDSIVDEVSNQENKEDE